MKRRISRDKIETMHRLYDQGLSVAEIARIEDVPFQTVYTHTAVRKSGFESPGEYQENLARERQKRLENKAVSDLITRRLKELKRTQSWLSNELRVTKGAVSKYAHGYYIPNKEILEKLFSALEVPYKTLDDLLKDADEYIEKNAIL